MRDEILSAAVGKNLFLAPEALEIIESNGYPMDFVNTLLNSLSKNLMFVTKQDVLDFLNGDKGLFEPEKVVKSRIKRNTDLQIIEGSDITGNSTCVGTIEDFANYFRSRFFQLKKILTKRRDFEYPLSIRKIKGLSNDREVNTIGMVYEKRKTKNGHLILTIEDEEETMPVFINKDDPLFPEGEKVVNDQVIGIHGRKASNGDLFIAKQIYQPDIPADHRWAPSDSTASVAFISDIHIGSKEFLRGNWEKMIQFLKAHSDDQQINYVIMPGDVVDGIGAYPDQEKDLEIMDIFDQYKVLSEYVKEIPDDIRIVLHPGNHDACRLAEPQPALAEIYTKTFDSNVAMVGNPINLKVEGKVIISYHGKSIDDWITGVRGMSYDDPLKVMEFMAKTRHLAPMYGERNALAPEKRDYLVMDYVPDIFVSGHVHGAGTMQYHGTRMINASTWQAQTDYQRKNNFNPNPGIMPLVNLGTGRTTMMNFMK